MSDLQQGWLPGFGGFENEVSIPSYRASLQRELRYLLTISSSKASRGHFSPSGLAHSVGVVLIEDWLTVRGKNGSKAEEGRASLPRFVDVKLTPEQRVEFAKQMLTQDECVKFLASAADDGYRVGVSWSGEQQSYTVSMTCRNPKSPNMGLCMTSFAGDLEKAISLANYKHCIVTEEVWSKGVVAAEEDFG